MSFSAALWWGNIKEQSDCVHHMGQCQMLCRASQCRVEERGNFCKISKKLIRCYLPDYLLWMTQIWSLETFTSLSWWMWWCLILPSLTLLRVACVLVSTAHEQNLAGCCGLAWRICTTERPFPFIFCIKRRVLRLQREQTLVEVAGRGANMEPQLEHCQRPMWASCLSSEPTPATASQGFTGNSYVCFLQAR